MKKALLLIVAALVAATLLGRWMAADSGYLLVIRDHWRLESTARGWRRKRRWWEIGLGPRKSGSSP